MVNAIREQNRQVAAGALGAPPAPGATDFQLSINTQGRLVDEEEFENIIVRAGEDGEITRLKRHRPHRTGFQPVRPALVAEQQPAGGGHPDLPAAGLQCHRHLGPGARAHGRAQAELPQGVDYEIVYDPTIFVRGSIEAVVHTLLEAIVLVVLVVILFLQTWRASIIPLAAVPVSLIGTFAVMHLLGFSLNALSLFGLVLAIGIVVDDAIVVVENVERNIGLGKSPVEATRQAMKEVTGPIIATALVLCAVFIPTAFISGLTGQFYQQFALTIAISTVISAFNSLTLSPALAATLLKAHDAPKDGFSRLLDRLFGGWLFRPSTACSTAPAMVTLAWYGASCAAVPWPCWSTSAWWAWGSMGFATTPTGFVPQQDKQYLVAFARLPDAATLDRTEGVIKRMSEIAGKHPGVENTVAFRGCRSTVSPTAPTAASSSSR